MTQYALAVPTPPPGTDWSTTVPGIYLYDVTGITATLDTGAPGIPLFHDASGNGYDGVYSPGADPTLAVNQFGQPGAVAGNDAVRMLAVVDFVDVAEVQTPMAIDVSHDVSVEWWMRATVANGGLPTFDCSRLGVPQVTVFVANDGTITFQRAGDALYVTDPGAFPLDGDWHLIDCCFDFDAPYRCNVDGVPVVIASEAPIGSRGVLNASIDELAWSVDAAAALQYFDESALYPLALSDGQCAIHYLERIGIIGYESAVLADGAQAYYHWDELIGGVGRTPGLAVTNGTNEVVLIGDGFAAQTTPGPYRYSWQPKQPNDTRAPDGLLTTVGIPELLLPGGYTIGTRTPDLDSNDQWSNVVVWWDDSIQQQQSPAAQYGYPPGATLRPRMIGTSS